MQPTAHARLTLLWDDVTHENRLSELFERFAYVNSSQYEEEKLSLFAFLNTFFWNTEEFKSKCDQFKGEKSF